MKWARKLRLRLMVILVLTLSLTLLIHYGSSNGKQLKSVLGKWNSIWRANTKHRSPNKTCKETIHIGFLKVHKAGSTTVMNILQRFGIVRELNFVLPKMNNILWFSQDSYSPKQLLPPPNNGSFDILCNHAMYNKNIFAQLLPRDTVYLAILRDPFQQFVSAFYYYRTVYSVAYLKKIPGPDPLLNYLKNLKKYTSSSFFYTNNQMAYDLGIPKKRFHDSVFLKTYITKLDKDFKLFLILEHFDESLVLLKRLLCWKTKDIIYIPANVGKFKPDLNSTVKDKTFKQWAFADYMLYDYFYKRFWEKVEQQETGFWDEVKSFKSISLKVKQFCLKAINADYVLVINFTKWNDPFEISFNECSFMLMPELKFVSYIRKKQYI